MLPRKTACNLFGFFNKAPSKGWQPLKDSTAANCKD